jgi:hypothetical protein
MTFLVSKRLLAKCRRNVKKVDHAFNVVTTPITFWELSFDDLSDQIPYRDAVTSIMSYIPNFQNVSNAYDSISIDKDIVESVVSLSRQAYQFKCMKDKERMLFILKCLSLFYKTIIVHLPMHEEHNIILNFLDYLNFVISCY